MPVDDQLIISDITKKESTLNKKFNKNYSEFIVDNHVSFLIDDCEEIGLKDPFPTENVAPKNQIITIPEKASDFVYPVPRLVFGISPSTIFMPSKKILFKFMRACIAVNSVEELWFN